MERQREISKNNVKLKLTEKEIDRSKWIKWKFSDLVENVVEKVTPKKSGLEHYIGLKHLHCSQNVVIASINHSSVKGGQLNG